MTIRMYEGILKNRKKLLKELGISQGPDRRETECRLIEAGYYIYRCVEEPKEKYVPYCSCSMVIDQEEGMRFFQNWKEYPFEKLVAEISGKIQDASVVAWLPDERYPAYVGTVPACYYSQPLTC